MDAAYLDRLVDAYTALQRTERRTDLDFAEITRRTSARLGRPVPSQTVGRWMSGEVQPREAAQRKAFAEALGTTVGWLFYAEGAETKKPADEGGLRDARAGSVMLTPAQVARAEEQAARDEAAASPSERPARQRGTKGQ